MAASITASSPHDIAIVWSRVQPLPVSFGGPEAVVADVEAAVVGVAEIGLTNTRSIKAAVGSFFHDAAESCFVQLNMMAAVVRRGVLALHVSVVAISAL